MTTGQQPTTTREVPTHGDAARVAERVARERTRLEREAGLDEPARNHFRRPEERPFLAHERDGVTILYGGFTLRHDRIIGAAMRGMGYHVQQIETPSKVDFQAGKEYGNNGQCNPTYFTVGALVNHLKHLRDDREIPTERILSDYVFVTAGACGPCRFGMYEAEYRLALRNSGFDGFRVILFQQKGGIDQDANGSGLAVNVEFALALVNGIMIGDILNELAYQIRPYEVHAGSTDRVFEQVLQRIEEAMRSRRATLGESVKSRLWSRAAATLSRSDNLSLILDQIISTHYTDALQECAALIDTIEVDFTRVKPICKITGEFWAQTTEGDGNFRMFSFLESQGAEVLVEPVTTWLLYMLAQERTKIQDEKGLARMGKPGLRLFGRLWDEIDARKRITRLDLATRVLIREYDRIRHALGGTPHAQINQLELQRVGHPYYNRKSAGGEGHLEVAKSIYYTNRGLAHMVLSLKPFGCMPSTQSDGAQAAVVAHFPDMIFIPIETSGEGDINAHSRAQMALGEAKAKSKAEFRECLERTGRSLEAIRAFCRDRREYLSPLHHVPHYDGVVGKAARFVLHVHEAMCRAEAGEPASEAEVEAEDATASIVQ